MQTRWEIRDNKSNKFIGTLHAVEPYHRMSMKGLGTLYAKEDGLVTDYKYLAISSRAPEEAVFYTKVAAEWWLRLIHDVECWWELRNPVDDDEDEEELVIA